MSTPPFVRLAFFPGATAEHYASLERELRGAPAPPGRRVFVAGAVAGGWQVVQVWDTRAELDAFNRDWLVPALARLGPAGFPAPPQVIDVRDPDVEIEGRRL